jgi:hypothetical protein
MSIIDRINRTIRSRNRRAFLIGVGSLIDLRGLATYEAMQDLMPETELTPLQAIYRRTNADLARNPSSSIVSQTSSSRG